MPDTTKELRLINPSVSVRVNEYDPTIITATLQAYRKKRDGSEEDWTIEFHDIDVFSLGCIANSAVRALREIRVLQDEVVKKRLSLATGWEEGEGP